MKPEEIAYWPEWQPRALAAEARLREVEAEQADVEQRMDDEICAHAATQDRAEKAEAENERLRQRFETQYAEDSKVLLWLRKRAEKAEAENERLREAGELAVEALRDCTPHYANGLPKLGQVIWALDQWAQATKRVEAA
jgi:chromosome segregation ATPase